MSIARAAREKKRQLGQFLTPPNLAARIVGKLADEFTFEAHHRVLEPSFGTGAFLIPLIERLMPLYEGSSTERLAQVLQNNLYGVELDPVLYDEALETIRTHFGELPETHHLKNNDFFRWFPSDSATVALPFFDVVIGNPPFGGTIDPNLQDRLNARYGFRCGEKIKKETYSFFLVKSLDLLKEGGQLRFICSDTFLTIKTMRGLRRLLMSLGTSELEALDYFSEETKHPMVCLNFTRQSEFLLPTEVSSSGSEGESCVKVYGKSLAVADIEKTPNLSWGTSAEWSRYFDGETLADYCIATSGMTVGNNALFLRPICDGTILEPYEFRFYEEPITVERELEKARLGKLSASQIAKFRDMEARGITRRAVKAIPLEKPKRIELPHPDYCFYNKASGQILTQEPTHVIYWKDEGDAVYTYRQNHNWYLHGVGGKKFFYRPGLTWQLIAPRLRTRLLPEGYVLDSGAPCAFLRPGVSEDELLFLLGWTLTETCNKILKTVINHTRNIQSKDFERLPYPFWLSKTEKSEAIRAVGELVTASRQGKKFEECSPEVRCLDALYRWRDRD